MYRIPTYTLQVTRLTNGGQVTTHKVDEGFTRLHHLAVIVS